MSNPTLFLATLNETLAFTDTSGAGTLTGVDPVRYDTIGAQEGSWVEQAASNYMTRCLIEGEVTSPAGSGGQRWQRLGSGVTITKVNDESPPFGTNALEVVTTGAGANEGIRAFVYGLGAQTGAALAMRSSIYVKGTGSLNVQTSVIYTDASGQAIQTSAITAGSEWTRYSPATFSLNAAKTVDYIYIDVRQQGTAASTFIVSCPQCEQSTYATSFLAGSLGDGYAFTGTAHASTSTRAASSVSVDQDTVARIDPASGAIAFRYKRLIDTGAEEIILTSGVAGSGTDYLEIGVDTSDDLYMEWNSDNAGAERVTITTTIAVDTEYFFYFDWDSTTIRASIDNGSLSSDTRAAAQGDWSTGDLTLSAAVGSHVIGPFAVFDRTLTSAERSRLYSQTTWAFNTLRDSASRANIFQLRPKAVS